jgi:hypothetical protein
MKSFVTALYRRQQFDFARPSFLNLGTECTIDRQGIIFHRDTVNRKG